MHYTSKLAKNRYCYKCCKLHAIHFQNLLSLPLFSSINDMLINEVSFVADNINTLKSVSVTIFKWPLVLSILLTIDSHTPTAGLLICLSRSPGPRCLAHWGLYQRSLPSTHRLLGNLPKPSISSTYLLVSFPVVLKISVPSPPLALLPFLISQLPFAFLLIISRIITHNHIQWNPKFLSCQK